MKRLSALGFIMLCVLCIAVGIMHLQSPPIKGSALPSARQMPAIHPDAAKLRLLILPTFTKSDVEQYLLIDPEISQDLSSRPGFRHTISFFNSIVLGKMLNDDFSTNASVLCYVEFTGPAPFALRDVKALSPPLFSKAYEVFDGLTGDEITWGA